MHPQNRHKPEGYTMRTSIIVLFAILLPAVAYAGGGDELVDPDPELEVNVERDTPYDTCPNAEDVSDDIASKEDAIDDCQEAKESQESKAEEAASNGDEEARKTAESNVTNINVQVNNLQTDLSELRELAEKNKSDIKDINQKIDDLNDRLDDDGSCGKDEGDSDNTDCPDLTALRKELNEKYETLYALFKGQRKKMDELSEKHDKNIRRLDEAIDKLEDRVEKNESDIADNTSDIDRNTRDIDSIEGKLSEDDSRNLRDIDPWGFGFGVSGAMRRPAMNDDEILRDQSALSLYGDVHLRKLCREDSHCLSTNVGIVGDFMLDDANARGLSAKVSLYGEHMMGDETFAYGPRIAATLSGYNLQPSGHHQLFGIGGAASFTMRYALSDDVAFRGGLGLEGERFGAKFDDGSQKVGNSINPFIRIGLEF